jgi:hypothetical protein
MTRARKVDPAVLEREYIYDSGNPPISLTQLSDKYGMARSGVADKARTGRWYERRLEFREQLGEKVVAALGDEWVRYEASVREKMMQVGLKYLDKYTDALDSGEIKASTKDMLGIAAMVRTLLGDIASNPQGEEELVDPDAATLSPDYYRKALKVIEQQLGDGSDGSLDAGEAAEAGAPGTGED